jgi:hypothetical protein
MSKWTTEQQQMMEQVEGKLASARTYGQQTPKGREHESLAYQALKNAESTRVRTVSKNSTLVNSYLRIAAEHATHALREAESTTKVGTPERQRARKHR